MFQIVKIAIKTPSGIKETEFIGKALFTPKEFDQIKNMSISTLIQNFQISPPIDIKDIPGEFDDLKEEIA